jgi:hypothetical protein
MGRTNPAIASRLARSTGKELFTPAQIVPFEPALEEEAFSKAQAGGDLGRRLHCTELFFRTFFRKAVQKILQLRRKLGR